MTVYVEASRASTRMNNGNCDSTPRHHTTPTQLHFGYNYTIFSLPRSGQRHCHCARGEKRWSFSVSSGTSI